jgi:hypothetical protein
MGFAPDPSYPCVKGPIPHCLDEVSKGGDARRRLEQLRDAITSIAPSYQGLETVFDTYLLVYVFDDPRVRENIVAHLKRIGSTTAHLMHIFRTKESPQYMHRGCSKHWSFP